MISPRRASILTACILATATFTAVAASAQTDCLAQVCTPKRSLLVVGDSLTVGAQSFGDLGDKLTARNNWSRVRIDAAIGRKIPRGVEIVKDQMQRNPFTGGFIVALGTNDLLSRRASSYHQANIEALLKAAKGKPVLWVNVTYSVRLHADYVERAKKFNAILVTLKKKYPNLTIASWFDHFSTTSPYWSKKDGIHISTVAYRDRARFITSAAAAWWKKVTTPPTTTTTIPATSSTDIVPDPVPS